MKGEPSIRVTKRELAYIKLAVRGYSNTEIASRIGVSSGNVVSNCMNRIRVKFQYRSLRQMWFELGRQWQEPNG